MKRLLVLPYLLLQGFLLFFMLPISMISKRAFNYFWRKYYMQPNLEPTIFNLCVQWLLYYGKKTGLDYCSINVLIFCVIWPIITVLSIVLNVYLTLRNFIV